jgi:murein tripeptide amidase MpaA
LSTPRFSLPLGALHNFWCEPAGQGLPLLIIDKDQHFNPETTSKTILLLQAGIHPGEPDGNDAGLLLIRDMVIHGKNKELLENITLLFIPIFNVDGYDRFGPYNRINQNGPKEMGWRTNAQNLNLNRDFIKADAPEMQAWLKLFNQWMPHFLLTATPPMAPTISMPHLYA